MPRLICPKLLMQPVRLADAFARDIGFNYGANLSLFPSYAKDLWGLKTFGMNYGILFTAWGMGGFVLSRLQQMLFAVSKNFDSSFVTAAILLLLGAVLTFLLRRPAPGHAVVPDLAGAGQLE
jgi:MFS transporter, OFA family, oxalate/formate antiporter